MFSTREFSATHLTAQFHAILALSTGTSWRQEGLLAAARLTDLDIVIPQQPSWSEEFVSAFQRFGEPNAIRPNRGSALAWLAHLDMLKLVIQSRLASALIMEDDVDWDVGIKVGRNMSCTSDQYDGTSLKRSRTKWSEPAKQYASLRTLNATTPSPTVPTGT